MARRLTKGYQRRIPTVYKKDKTIEDLLTLSLMKQGKKEKAERIVKSVQAILKTQYNIENPIKFIEETTDKIKPLIKVKSVRLAGTSYQIPVQLDPTKQMYIALKWLVQSANKNNSKTVVDGLAKELIDASQEKGSVIKKRNELHKIAVSNRAISHFRW